MNNNTLLNIRKNIVDVRKNKQITQYQLAKMIGTKQSSISRFENGKHIPDLLFLSKIANSLGAELILDLKINNMSIEEKRFS